MPGSVAIRRGENSWSYGARMLVMSLGPTQLPQSSHGSQQRGGSLCHSLQ